MQTYIEINIENLMYERRFQEVTLLVKAKWNTGG